jgi:hypothetical protein
MPKKKKALKKSLQKKIINANRVVVPITSVGSYLNKSANVITNISNSNLTVTNNSSVTTTQVDIAKKQTNPHIHKIKTSMKGF